MYNLLEKPTILEKDTIINTIQLEREFTNAYIYSNTSPDTSTNSEDTYALDTIHNRHQTPQLYQITIQMT